MDSPSSDLRRPRIGIGLQHAHVATQIHVQWQHLGMGTPERSKRELLIEFERRAAITQCFSRFRFSLRLRLRCYRPSVGSLRTNRTSPLTPLVTGNALPSSQPMARVLPI